MNTMTRPAGYDVALVICGALGLLGSVTEQPLHTMDVISTVIFSILIGVGGTTAILKYKGVIQVHQEAPAEIGRRQRRQVGILVGLVVAAVTLFLWHMLK